jgi:hypothetical protein
MLTRPAANPAASRQPLFTARLGALAVFTACSLAACGGGVTESVSTAVKDSSSAVATARIAIRQDSAGKLTPAATATTLDDALKELQTSRDTVLKLSPGSEADRSAIQETLTVLDTCTTGLTTARNAVSSNDGVPSLADGDRELAVAADRLSQLSAKDGGK